MMRTSGFGLVIVAERHRGFVHRQELPHRSARNQATYERNAQTSTSPLRLCSDIYVSESACNVDTGRCEDLDSVSAPCSKAPRPTLPSSPPNLRCNSVPTIQGSSHPRPVLLQCAATGCTSRCGLYGKLSQS